jgi:hypothetical protein
MQRRTIIHRVTAWVALLCHGLVAAGLPLPLGAAVSVGRDAPAARRLADKDRSQPFPCMDKPCGCTTAAQCFANCCCNTPAELLAWAKANRVDPAVTAALARRAAPASSCCIPKPPAREPGCCATAAQSTCCAEAARAPGRESAPPTIPEPEAEPVSAHTVVLRAMLACGGLVAQWLAMASALPPRVVRYEWAATPIDSLILIDEFSLGERAAPDSPPPRTA